MSIYWSQIAKDIEPYVPGEQPRDKKYIKLNTNENPYPPSPKVLEAIRQAANGDLRLYPDPSCTILRETIAKYYGLNIDEVFVGNGSDEILAFAFLAYFNPGKPILFPDITYSFYPVYSKLFNIDYSLVHLSNDFSIPVEEFFGENGGVIIANPNAPTGKYMCPELIEEIVKRNINSVVIIDEAYIDFGGESSVRLIRQYPNILVVKTLSKSRSLAGLRLGYALGQKDLLEGLDRIKNSINSYTIDRLGLLAAVKAIEDEDYFNNTRFKIINTRERISGELVKSGFKVVESKANFIFISHPSVRAADIFKQLKDRGVLVRYFNKPRIDNYLRVSIGSDEEMDVFLRAVSEIVAG
jgi:histidinol-phosphate aminotransferase